VRAVGLTTGRSRVSGAGTPRRNRNINRRSARAGLADFS